MKIIDFSAIKSGGGAQIAANFLKAYRDLGFSEDVLFLLPDVGPLSANDYLSNSSRNFIVPSSSLWRRFYFELITYPRLVKRVKADVCFSFFGAGLPKIKNVRQITTVAYPIICYDESSYWKYLSSTKYEKKKLLNFFRKRRIKSADLVLVETEIMRRRISQILSIKNVKLLPPAVSSYVSEGKIVGNKRTILLLSGNAPHKNLWRLPSIARGLEKKCKELDFEFLVTVNSDYFDVELPASINCVGSVSPEDIGDLYRKSEFLLSLSDLESFSNNYMEAWATRTLLIVSDRDFARNICRDSAYFLEPHDIVNSIDVIGKALNASLLDNNRMLDAGENYLNLLPSNQERTKLIFDYICEDC